MKRLIVLASMTIALGGVAACSSTGGTPVPATNSTPTGATTGNDPGSSSTNQPPSTDIADANACSLLTASEATSFGLPSAGNTADNGAKSGCEWDGTNYIVGVLIRTDVGLAGVLANGGTITNTQVGSHQAKQLTESSGGCLYAIGINDSTRVDVETDPISNSNSACQESLSIAQVVEKHLPS